MTWAQLTNHRKRLNLTEVEMARLVIGCSNVSTYTGWNTRNKIPTYAIYAVEHFMLLAPREQQWLMSQRRKECGL